MAGSAVRRPLPALVALLALLLLTALVWWRVLHRDGGEAAGAQPCPSASASHTSAAASRVLPRPASVDVLVLNATSRNGIAKATRTALLADGFRSPHKAANDLTKLKASVTGVAQIRYGASSKPAASLLHYYFPHAQLVSTGSKATTVTISLGPKYKKTASRAAVRVAMATDGKSLARGTPTPTPSASTSGCTGSASPSG